MGQLEPDSNRPPIYPELTLSQLMVGLVRAAATGWSGMLVTRQGCRAGNSVSSRAALIQRIMGLVPFFKCFIECHQSKKLT